MRMIRRAAFAAVIAAAGLWICAPGSGEALAAGATNATKSRTAAADKPVKLSKFTKRHAAQAGKKSRQAQSRHARKTAAAPSSKTMATKVAADKDIDKSADRPPLDKVEQKGLPPSVANAHAEAFAKDEAQNLAALDDNDVVVKKDGVQIAEADQLNDTDRVLTPETATPETATSETAAPAAATLPAAPTNKIIKAVPATGEPAVVKTGDSDPWNKTSLIGKIFIAFGSLLTLASAARLFIA